MNKPAGSIRVKAIAIVPRRSDVLLSFAIDPESGARYGRFLGGGIEPGERAEETIRRELREEIGVEIGDVVPQGVVENIYAFAGQTYHEIIVVCLARFADPAVYAVPSFPVNEAVCDGPAEWIPIQSIVDGEVIVYPPELGSLLRESRAHHPRS